MMMPVNRGPLSVDKNKQSASGGETPSLCVIGVRADILSETALLEKHKRKTKGQPFAEAATACGDRGHPTYSFA
jgi:hypothetical protein